MRPRLMRKEETNWRGDDMGFGVVEHYENSKDRQKGGGSGLLLD